MARSSDEERCRESKRYDRIDAAFAAGDIAALRAALDEPDDFPNTWCGMAIGTCLVYAVYRSPLAFIRELLELGADPNSHDNDGFPPVIAALSSMQEAPGSRVRPDAPAVIELLLEYGADVNQRGLNDYTPLIWAAGSGYESVVRLLLAHGADVSLRTRIDDLESARDAAARAGHAQIVALLDEATGRR